MSDRLAPYRRKRNFRSTPEPRGTRARRGGARRFVVQRHAARRLHYDFRLEWDGVLKSWAVPKGPSLQPGEKRLAVHVEDHPLDYIDFEGVIPAKQYGAGEVRIWDRGRWLPEGDVGAGLRAGKLRFQLQGKRLHGGWTLVRTGDTASGGREQWLLIKRRDDGPGDAPRPPASPARAAPTLLSEAVEATLPETLRPQLATLMNAPPASGDWTYELKFDGYRLLTRVAGNAVRLLTRNGRDWTTRLPELARAIQELELTSAWLDGEIVVLDARGVPDFQGLQNAFDNRRTDTIRYFVFDLPYHHGYDLRRVPLSQRRARLKSILADTDTVRVSEDFAHDPHSILDSACRLGFEGVIGKRRDGAYLAGRSRSWIKLKCRQRQEFVIGGYTEPRGTRIGFGALLLGVYEHGALRYAGRVGTGFDAAQLQSLQRRLARLRTPHSRYADPPRGRQAQDVYWIEPRLVADVSFTQWTRDGLVRQAVFHGLRTDKPARQVRRERPDVASAPSAPVSTPARARNPDRVAGVRITHPARVIDAESGLTKIDLARYYESAASRMLPHLKGRPVALLRAPQGLDGERFFQKHVAHMKIPGVRSLARKLDPGHAPLMVIDSVSALVGAVQMGAVEFHTWNAVARAIESPDRFILDLDPDPALPWSRVVEAARLTHTLLDELGLPAFLKTSGGVGLHVVVPLRRRHSWNAVRTFSRAIARHLAATIPEYFSAKMGPQNRVRKIYVDYLRNRRGASTAAAYSVRARGGLAVSVPISWEELETLDGANAWNVRTVDPRWSERDPWEGYSSAARVITADMKKALAVEEESEKNRTMTN